MQERSFLETGDIVEYKLYKNVPWMMSYKVFVDRKSNVQIEYNLYSSELTEPFEIKFALNVAWMLECELSAFLC